MFKVKHYLIYLDHPLTVEDHLNELEILDDSYFQKDREGKIQEKYDQIIEIVEREYSNFGKGTHN